MKILDTNLLLYAVDAQSPQHALARQPGAFDRDFSRFSGLRLQVLG